MLISAYHLYYIYLHESLNSVNNLWYLPLHCRLTSQKACPGKEELLGSGWPGRGRENKKQLVPFLINQITTKKKNHQNCSIVLRHILFKDKNTSHNSWDLLKQQKCICQFKKSDFPFKCMLNDRVSGWKIKQCYAVFPTLCSE